MKDFKQLPEKLSDALPKIKHYLPILFGVLILGLYGFLLLRINTLSTAEPSVTDLTTQQQTASIPHVDPAVVKQLQSLQDNSTSVQSLFNQARDNPFEE